MRDATRHQTNDHAMRRDAQSAPSRNPRASMALPESAPPAIELIGAGRDYGRTVAVHPVDLRIERGEFVSFLGPSGSGKTTTLNLIAGFAAPSCGEVMIGGTPMTRVPPHRRGIGVVFQHYALFPHMTVYRNVEFPLKRRRIPARQRHTMIARTLDTVGLDGYADRYPAELSGGQQQRVALARALVFEPEVLLMDEPLGALDRKLRESLQSEIKRIHREVQTTFVYVTHDQDEALALSDRIAVFNGGRVEQLAAPDELYRHPSSLFVAEFVGDSTVLRGPLVRGSRVTTLQFHGHDVRVPARLEGAAHGAILLRPEALYLIPFDADASPPDVNAVAVRVVDRLYLGSSWKYEVLLPDGTLGLVKHSDAQTPSVSPGDRALMTWSPAAGTLLPDPNASSSAEIPPTAEVLS